ncbi:MAG: hypothetical protein PHT07_10110 [Paludibacter sp.]|nr:hypothetical protein [Paludibacter sp.]
MKDSNQENKAPNEVVIRREVVTLESGEIASTTVVFKKNFQVIKHIDEMGELLRRQKDTITAGDIQSSLESSATMLQILESLREDFQAIESELLESFGASL